MNVLERSKVTATEKSTIKGTLNVRNHASLFLRNMVLEAGTNILLYDHSCAYLSDGMVSGYYRIGIFCDLIMSRTQIYTKNLFMTEKSTLQFEKTKIKNMLGIKVMDVSKASISDCVLGEKTSFDINGHSVLRLNNCQADGVSLMAHQHSEVYLKNSICGENIFLGVNEASWMEAAGVAIEAAARISCHHDSRIQIGENCKAMKNLYILVNHGSTLQVGKDCAMANDVTILSGDSHPIFQMEAPQIYEAKSKVALGDHVWLGKGCFILSNTLIGESSIVAPNSVCGKKYPNNCLIMGYPARVIRKDIAYDLEESDPDQILDRTYWKLTDMGKLGSNCQEDSTTP